MSIYNVFYVLNKHARMCNDTSLVMYLRCKVRGYFCFSVRSVYLLFLLLYVFFYKTQYKRNLACGNVSKTIFKSGESDLSVFGIFNIHSLPSTILRNFNETCYKCKPACKGMLWSVISKVDRVILQQGNFETLSMWAYFPYRYFTFMLLMNTSISTN